VVEETSLRVRWRLGGGSTGAWQTLTFKTGSQAIQARLLVRAHRGAIDRQTVFATVMKLPVPDGTQASGAPTVRDLLNPWLISKHELTPGVIRRYRRMFEFAILPLIGHLPVDNVSPTEIDSIITALKTCDCAYGVLGRVCSRRKGRRPGSGPHSDGLTKGTIDRYYVTLKGFFWYVVRRKLITDNPVAEVSWRANSLSKYNATKKEETHFYMTPLQFRLLRSRMDSRYHAFIELLVQTGMRFGEATALTVGQVHLTTKPHPGIGIISAWKLDEDGKFYVGLPKGNSVRTVSVRPELIQVLRPFLENKQPEDLVFTSPRGERLDGANFWSEFWTPAVVAAMRCPDHPVPNRGKQIPVDNHTSLKCGENGGLTDRGKKCGARIISGWDRCGYHLGPDPVAVSDCECWENRLPKRPVVHDLRHTHAAKLIRDNIPLKAISMRLGHSSVQITEVVYAGLLEEINDDIVAASGMDGE